MRGPVSVGLARCGRTAVRVADRGGRGVVCDARGLGKELGVVLSQSWLCEVRLLTWPVAECWLSEWLPIRAASCRGRWTCDDL